MHSMYNFKLFSTCNYLLNNVIIILAIKGLFLLNINGGISVYGRQENKNKGRTT